MRVIIGITGVICSRIWLHVVNMNNTNHIIRNLKRLNTALRWLSIDLRAIVKSTAEIPRYLADRRRFAKMDSERRWKLNYYPVLLDRGAPSAALGEYFWQDIFVAKKIIEDNPLRHVDVGSRVDGFIAHLACVREVTVFDIRPLTAQIERVKFVQWDITQPNPEYIGIADCVSCLHTLEHIGLGRYGDRLDPDGWKKGLVSLINLVTPGGKLWISVPIGVQRIEFNAHRVFHPSTIIDTATAYGMRLDKMYYTNDRGVHEVEDLSEEIKALSQKNYSLGIFLFMKKNEDLK